MDEKGFVKCYQEYLQGPCQNGQQFILPDLDNPELEPTCVPTDCPNGQVKYKNNCIPVQTCPLATDIVIFNSEDLTSECTSVASRIIDAENFCKDGQVKNSFGECTDVNTPVRTNRRSTLLTYGRVRNLRSFILNRRRFG